MSAIFNLLCKMKQYGLKPLLYSWYFYFIEDSNISVEVLICYLKLYKYDYICVFTNILRCTPIHT